MTHKIDLSTVNEILNLTEKLYKMSQTYLTNIVGTYIENNKLKVLDPNIINKFEIKGGIQIIHLQLAIEFYCEKNNKYNNELKQIMSEGTINVVLYNKSDKLPKTYNHAVNFLLHFFEEKVDQQLIIYFSSFYIDN